MVHISYGMKEPASPQLRSECAILAGLAQATLPGSGTPWQWYVERLRPDPRHDGPGARRLRGLQPRVRHPHGFRISQPARERGFLTPSGRAEFGLAPLPGDIDPGEGRLMLATVRSHDQFNTTIYSNDDRYRGLKGLRTVVFMNDDDMQRPRAGRVRPHRHHQLQQGRQHPGRLRLPRRQLRHPARLRGRVHARAERPVRHRRLQHAERAARHQAPRSRGDRRLVGRKQASDDASGREAGCRCHGHLPEDARPRIRAGDGPGLLRRRPPSTWP